MSTWLHYRVPRYLVKCHFWVCLWACFWIRLTFESADWVKKAALSEVGGHHPHWGSKDKSKSRKGVFSLGLPVWAGTLVFSDLHRGTCTASSPRSPGRRPVYAIFSASIIVQAHSSRLTGEWRNQSPSLPASPMDSVSLENLTNTNTYIFLTKHCLWPPHL